MIDVVDVSVPAFPAAQRSPDAAVVFLVLSVLFVSVVSRYAVTERLIAHGRRDTHVVDTVADTVFEPLAERMRSWQ